LSVERSVADLCGHRDRCGQKGLRLPIAINLALSLLLAALAVALRDPYLLAVLGVANLFYLILTQTGWKLLWKAGRLLLWQSALLLFLHYLRSGPEGILPGLRISCQLLLAFVPGMIFLQSTSRSQLVQLINRFLPATAAFVLAASLHFLPLLLAEVKTIYQMQLLRGARIDRRDMCKPWCWPDWVTCLIVPCTVQALTLAGDIALAARARDFGVSRRRTCWPGEDSSRKERELCSQK
jgi:energy-coupling factor transport system permease protein